MTVIFSRESLAGRKGTNRNYQIKLRYQEQPLEITGVTEIEVFSAKDEFGSRTATVSLTGENYTLCLDASDVSWYTYTEGDID